MGRQLQLLLKKKDKTVMIKRTICIKRGKNMNFHNKKTRRIMAIVIIVIVADCDGSAAGNDGIESE